MNYIFIDGSYFIFYKYHALKTWWNFAKKKSGEELPEQPIESEEFVMRFKKTFADKVNEIAKKLKIKNPIYMVGKDCPRSDIWRTQSNDTYKDGRKPDTGIGPFFKMVYEEKLFENAGVGAVLEHPSLEADDCIAITVKYILDKHDEPDLKIHIITSDMDYLQLASDKVDIYSLKFKKLQDSKQSFKDANKDLFFKIVQGDKSDNIPPIFDKCGPKEVLKCYEDREYFEKKLQKFSAHEKYAFNKKMIDFNEIPEELVYDFKKKVLLSS